LVFDRVNAYHTRLLDGIRSVLLLAGVPFVVYVHDSYATQIRPVAKRLVESGEVHGAITTMLSHGPSQTDLSNMFNTGSLPMVHIGSATENGWSVGVDNASSMHSLMCHLLDEVGARRIVIVRGPAHQPDSREREEVVCAELRARGLAVARIIEGGFDRDVAYNSTTRLLEGGDLPDAVVALNDRSALGVLDALQDAHIKIPAEIAVSGFDDEAIARRRVPRLTTVSQELFAQGALAAQLLLRQIGGAPPTGHVLQPGRLIIRGSTRLEYPVQTLDPSEESEQSEQVRAVAAMDRAPSINRAFMACRSIRDLLSAVGANITRLGLRRCFIVLNGYSDEAPPSSGVLVLRHIHGRTQITADAPPFPLADVLPDRLRDEINSGSLVLHPLSVDDLDLGYVLFEEIEPDRCVGELLGMDLSRAIDSLQRTQQQAHTHGSTCDPTDRATASRGCHPLPHRG
jgi:LacI family transcriptional regulator